MLVRNKTLSGCRKLLVKFNQLISALKTEWMQSCSLCVAHKPLITLSIEAKLGGNKLVVDEYVALVEINYLDSISLIVL